MTADATHQTPLYIAKIFHSSKDPHEEVAAAPSDTPLEDGWVTCLYSAHLHQGVYPPYTPRPTQKKQRRLTHIMKWYREILLIALLVDGILLDSIQ